jgi:hypothetical protein
MVFAQHAVNGVDHSECTLNVVSWDLFKAWKI